jgi:hypothetical protein
MEKVRPPSPAMAPGAALGGGVPGSAATPTARTLSSLPPPSSGAPGATTKGPAEGAAPNPPATGAGDTTGTGGAKGAKSGELASGMLAAALAADIAKLPPEQAASLKPMLDALVASETARQLNFASWDTYRVAQWKKVFDQSVALSWFIFVAVHVIVGVALLVSIGEFFRSERIARTKSRERAQRRADMATGLQRIAALAPEAQSAAAAKAVALAEDTAKQDTDLEVSANKLVLRTSVMGFVLMAFALAFYALFIIFVYPVQQGGKTLDARTAPATSPFAAP